MSFPSLYGDTTNQNNMLKFIYLPDVFAASLTGDSGAPEVNDVCLRAWRAHTDYGEGLADPAAVLYRASTSSPPAAAATAAANSAATSSASSTLADDKGGKQQVAWFWEALAGLAPTERAMVWQFATGRSYPPRDAAGFAAMDPLFTLVGSSSSSSSSATGLVPGLGSIRAATSFHQLQLPPTPGFTSVLALRRALLESAAEANAAANLALSSDSAGGGDGTEEAIFDDSFAARTRRLQAAVARAAAEVGARISASSSTGKGLGSVDAAKLSAELRKQFPNAHQCKVCGCGPVINAACDDLKTHHGEASGGGSRVSNACPQCGWYSPSFADWPLWDGHVRTD